MGLGGRGHSETQVFPRVILLSVVVNDSYIYTRNDQRRRQSSSEDRSVTTVTWR